MAPGCSGSRTHSTGIVGASGLASSRYWSTWNMKAVLGWLVPKDGGAAGKRDHITEVRCVNRRKGYVFSTALMPAAVRGTSQGLEVPSQYRGPSAAMLLACP